MQYDSNAIGVFKSVCHEESAGAAQQGGREGHGPSTFSDINFSVGKIYDAENFSCSIKSTRNSLPRSYIKFGGKATHFFVQNIGRDE